MSHASCYRKPSLELWSYLLYAHNNGENPWQIFHAMTSYGAWPGALSTLELGSRNQYLGLWGKMAQRSENGVAHSR